MSVAFAASIVVNPGGGGNYTTIQAAINNAAPGDTIAIKTGTYTENLNLSLMGSAIGGTTGNLQLVAIDGPGTVNLTGAGTKISHSGAFNGSLVINGLNIATTNEDGIRLSAFTNLTIVNSTFDPIGSDNTGHNGLELTVGSGVPNIVLYQNTFRNIANDAIQIVAQGSAQPTFTIVGNTITDNGIHANTTDQAIAIEMRGTVNGLATIVGNTLTQLESRAVALAANEAAQVRAQVVGNTIDTISTVDQAIVAETLNAATTALLDVTIANNTIQNISSGNGVQVMMGGVTATPSTPSIVARIVGNTLSNIGNNDFDRGIVVIPGISNNTNLNGTISVLVADNQLTNIAASGLYIFADDSIDVDATVRNNTFINAVAFPSANEAGFLFRTNNAAARLRLALTNNTATTVTPGTNREIRLLHQTGTFQLEGNAALTVEQNVAADNPPAADSILVGGTIGIIARGTVAAPGEVDPPVAQDDSATAVSGIATTINVLANDLDPNATPVGLQYFTFNSLRGGTVTRNDNSTPGNLTDDRLVYTSPAGYAGSDTLYYTSTDGTGSDVALVTITVVIDSTPPDTTITVFPGNPSNDNTPTFQFTGTDNVTAPASLTFQCRLYLASSTPSSYTSCTSPFTSATLPDGTYTFQVRAVDQVGNIDPTPAQYTWQIDTTGPTVTINTNPTNPTNSASASFTFSASDGAGTGVAGFSCSLDGAPFSACTSPQPYSGLADGSHTFQVRATDNAGNTGAIASFTWVVDTIPPDTTITTNPTAISNSSTATFQFTGNPLGGSGVASFECALDGGAFGTCISPQVYTGLTDGSHTFQVRAKDAASNVDATPASYTWVVDTTAPAAPVVNAPANGSATNNAQPPVTGTAEPGSTVNIFVDGSVVGNTTADGSGNWSFTPPTPLANGSHTVRARASDAAGNTSPDSNTNTFTVDTTPPAAPVVIAPANGSSTGNNKPVVSGTAEANSTVTVIIDGSPAGTVGADGSGNWSFTPAVALADGPHTARARASDAVGNVSADSNTNTFTVDTVAPAAPVVVSPADGSVTGNNRAPIGGTAEPGSTVTVYVDGASIGTATANGSGNWSIIPPVALADGSHTARARASDAAGNTSVDSNTNTFTVDTTAPVVPVVTTPANGSTTNNVQPPVTGTAEANSTVTVVIDGSPAGTASADGSGNWSLTPPTPLANGSHTVRARATDAASNTSPDSNTNTFTVDTVEPDTTFTGTPPAASSSTSANFTFSGNGTGSAVSSFECSLDGAAFTTCTSPQNLTGLAEGSHTLQVRAVDAAGNTETTPASYTWTVDLTAPDTTITASPTALSNSASATFTFTGNDPTNGGVASGVASFECRLDGGAFNPCASGLTLTGLSDGTHTFEVRAIDNASNVDASPASFTWTIDTTAPAAPVVNTPANGAVTNNAQPPVTGTAEPNSTVTISINGSQVGTTVAGAAGNWSFTPSALSDATYTVRARATDAASNTSPDSNTNTFTVDTVEPDTTFTATPAVVGNSTDATFEFSGNGTGSAISSFECSLDGAVFATCTSPQNLTGLTEGSHTLQVRAVDGAGNVESSPASHSWTVDLTAPDTTITASPTALSNDATPTFEFSGDDPVSGGAASGVASFECSLDASPFSGCATPLNLTGLSDGTHTFEVRAIDAAGNVDASPASFTWTIDATAPAAPVVLTPADGSVTNNAQPPVTGTAEPGSTVTVFIDSAAVGTVTADGAGNWSLTPATPLGEGVHKVKATATDAAGSTGPDSNSNSFTVDTLAPDTTITASPPLASSSSSASFDFTASDGSGTGVASYECALDGGAFAACTSPQPYTGLGDGPHTFEVRALDSAGNVDPTPAAYTWTVDTAAPETTIVSGPAAVGNSSDATFDFSSDEAGVTYECSLDGGAYALCTDPVTFSGIADGAHTLDVRAVDAAGNTDTTPATYSWLVDTAPVTATVEQASGQSDPTDTAPISFTVAFNKPVSGFGDSPSDVTLAGTAPGTLSAAISGGPSVYTVRVSGMTGGGTVIASVAAGAASDSAGNANGASTSSDNSVTFAPTDPVVTGIVRAGASLTRAVSVDFRVTFSEDVAGVDAGDFTLVTAGLSGAAITGVNGSGTTWTVTVNTGGGSGTLGLGLADDDSIVSVRSAIPLGGVGPANGSLEGEAYLIDRLAPTAALVTPAPVAHGSAIFTFTVVFSDNVAVRAADLDGSDIVVTGPGGFNQAAALVSATPTGDGSPIVATYRIAAPGGAWDVTDNGTYTVALAAAQLGDTVGNKAAGGVLGTFTVGAGSVVFLPLIVKPAEPVGLPDLVVDSVRVAGGGVEVVIRNAGTAPATNPFWVDVYLAPRAAPTAVNQVWETLGDYGAVWGVTGGALPLAPGASLTLRLGDAYYRGDKSALGVSLPAGATVYAQVDSANAGVAYGAVLETHERDGGAYNNIAESVVGAGGATLPAAPAPAAAAPSADLPRRSR